MLLALNCYSELSNSPQTQVIRVIDEHGPEINDIPSDQAFAINTNSDGWFSYGVTLKDDKSGYYYSTTYAHNLCSNPSQLLSYIDNKIISTRYERARFYWQNQTKAALLYKKIGYFKDYISDLGDYTVYEHPPIGYEVEKYGAASKTTYGTIISTQSPFVKPPIGCLSSLYFEYIIFVK